MGREGGQEEGEAKEGRPLCEAPGPVALGRQIPGWDCLLSLFLSVPVTPCSGEPGNGGEGKQASSGAEMFGARSLGEHSSKESANLASEMALDLVPVYSPPLPTSIIQVPIPLPLMGPLQGKDPTYK